MALKPAVEKESDFLSRWHRHIRLSTPGSNLMRPNRCQFFLFQRICQPLQRALVWHASCNVLSWKQ
jgi:hypothetical protein